jgi:hypothetical protein
MYYIEINLQHSHKIKSLAHNTKMQDVATEQWHWIACLLHRLCVTLNNLDCITGLNIIQMYA